MDLWIRTQNKKFLLKIESGLKISNYFSIFAVYQIETFSNKTNILGFYKSEERALQILDEIQDFMQQEIENDYAKKETKFNEFETIKYFKEKVKPDCLVYEMPKE